MHGPPWEENSFDPFTSLKAAFSSPPRLESMEYRNKNVRGPRSEPSSIFKDAFKSCCFSEVMNKSLMPDRAESV